MYLANHLRKGLCLILIFFSFSAYAAPMLNGLAIHSELGKEQFLGALYSEVLSNDPETLIKSNLPMRMELKIVAAEGMAIRRFSRMWIEGMAINNNSALLTAQADNMVKFDGLFKGRLEPNDHVVFALTPGSGVAVRINNVLLGTIADDEFFSMLLRTWIGRVPLSSTYRENLLKVGDVPANLRARYNAIEFAPARVAEVTAWTRATPEPAAVVVQTPPPARETPRAESPAPVITPPIARIELPQLERPPVTDSNQPDRREPPAPAPAPATTSQLTIPTPAVAADDEEDDAQPALTTESLLARQFYVSDVLRKIRGNVRYPRLSEQRGQEGSMRIAVTINRSGNITNMTWLEESRHDRLNKEAWDAVIRSAPFPPMPDSLSGQTFELAAPISFEMAK